MTFALAEGDETETPFVPAITPLARSGDLTKTKPIIVLINTD
jgi:hypothetical protein